jgi:hypothetical protein
MSGGAFLQAGVVANDYADADPPSVQIVIYGDAPGRYEPCSSSPGTSLVYATLINSGATANCTAAVTEYEFSLDTVGGSPGSNRRFAGSFHYADSGSATDIEGTFAFEAAYYE